MLERSLHVQKQYTSQSNIWGPMDSGPCVLASRGFWLAMDAELDAAGLDPLVLLNQISQRSQYPNLERNVHSLFSWPGTSIPHKVRHIYSATGTKSPRSWYYDFFVLCSFIFPQKSGASVPPFWHITVSFSCSKLLNQFFFAAKKQQKLTCLRKWILIQILSPPTKRPVYRNIPRSTMRINTQMTC